MPQKCHWVGPLFSTRGCTTLPTLLIQDDQCIYILKNCDLKLSVCKIKFVHSVSTLGFGSDYVKFMQCIGVPSVDLLYTYVQVKSSQIFQSD